MTEQPTTAHTEPGYQADQPWTARFGMVRPRHGRYVAGVCAGIARATNTDPLLWRVIIGVLSIFGVGIAIYIAAWLLSPAEGDTGSPLEATFGRGQSSTSTGLTLGLAIVGVIMLGAITNSFLVGTIAAVGLVVAALAVNSRGRIPAAARMDTTATSAPPHGSVTEPIPQAGYQPPFAPYGPYGGSPVPVPPPMPPKPKREPSRLGRLIFGLTLVAIGGLGFADMAFASIPASTYFAVALAVVGLGLIIGAWFGRARGFIVIGLVLSLALPIAVDESNRERGRPGMITWAPTDMATLSDSYEHRFGSATLDLSELDFNGQDREVKATISFGDMVILLPPNVDVIIDADADLGEASVLGREGLANTRDNGDDGPGGGTLRLQLEVRFGYAEVRR